MRKQTNRHIEQVEKDQVGEMTDDFKGISPVDVMMNESINATGRTNKGLSTGWVQDVCCKFLNVMVDGRTSDGNQLLRLHGL